MNRRSFFSSLGALVGAASLSPTIFIPKFEPVKWKRIVVPNKGWFVAEFEQYFIDAGAMYDKIIFHRRHDEPLVPSPKSIIKLGGDRLDSFCGTWKWEEPK